MAQTLLPIIFCYTDAVLAQTAPATFEANPIIGGGVSQYQDSAHFRIYNATREEADAAIKLLEGAYACFVDGSGWSSSGLSIRTSSASSTYYKTNIYSVGSGAIGGAAGQMWTKGSAGFAFLKVVDSYLTDANCTCTNMAMALPTTQRLGSSKREQGLGGRR